MMNPFVSIVYFSNNKVFPKVKLTQLCQVRLETGFPSIGRNKK